MKSVPRLVISIAGILGLGLLAACSSTAKPTAKTAPQTGPVVQTLGSRLADTRSYATFYTVPDQATVDKLAGLDLAILQPNAVNADQIRAIQMIGKAIAYLSVGEVGDSNTYYVGGQPVQGITIRQAHPDWFVGKNPSFDSYFVDPTSTGWKNFLVQQADYLINTLHFDGIFMDTMDTVDVFTPENKAAFGLTTPVTYAQAKTGFISIVKALRAVDSQAPIISNRGFSILLNSENGGDGMQGYIDAVMYEVATTVFYHPGATGEINPNDGTNPDYYWTWPGYLNKKLERGELTPAQRDKQVADNLDLDRIANAYHAAGGVVLAQDFATPSRTDLICQAYVRAKANSWVPSYADIGFRYRYEFPETSATIRALPGCANYDYTTASDYQVTFTPRVANIGQGRGKTLTLSITPVGGYTGPVHLRLGQLPTGVTGTLSATDVTPSPTTTVSLTLSAAATVPAQEYIVPVVASSWGNTMRYDLRLVVYNSQESLWVTNAGNFTASVYDNVGSLSSSSTPARSLGGAAQYAQLYAVAVDAAGKQYLLEYTSQSYPTGRVLRYGSFDSGAPEQIISQGLNYPTGLAIDAGGTVWVANSGLLTNGTSSGTAPSLVAYAPGANSPTQTIPVDPTAFGNPKQLAFDASGNLWVSTTFGFALGYKNLSTSPTRFAAIGDAYPTAAYLNTVNGLRFDAAGNLWLSGALNGAGRVVQVKAGSWASDGSVTTLSSANVGAQISSGLYTPYGLAFDSGSNLWVVNETDASGTGPGSVVRYDAASLGANPSPSLTLPQATRYPLGIAIARP